MKVNNHALEVYSQGTVARSAECANVAASASKAATRSSRSEAAILSISSEARDLAAAAAPQVDLEKVNALRDKVRQGTFAVDAAAIAERMLDRLA